MARNYGYKKTQNQLRKAGWPEHSFRTPDKIFSNIWLSGIAFDEDIVMWAYNKGFTHILNACGSGGECMYLTDPNVVNINYLSLEMEDSPDFNILDYLEKSYNFINQAYDENGKLLIHCMWGQSRSVSCLVHFIMKKWKICYVDAKNIVVYYRPEALPNSGFASQLISLQNDLLK